MKPPNAERYTPDPQYLRNLIAKVGITQAEAARRLGVSPRMMRYYLSNQSGEAYDCPYTVQYCLEALKG